MRSICARSHSAASRTRDHGWLPHTAGIVRAEAGQRGRTRERDALIFFNYVGSDVDFYYFTTAEDKRYKVARAECGNLLSVSLDGGMQLFVTAKDGKLTVPDPKDMAGKSEDKLLHKPYKKKP